MEMCVIYVTMLTSDAEQIKCKNCHVSFVPNYLSYVSDKYYLNWLTVGNVITEIKRVNVFKNKFQVEGGITHQQFFVSQN